MRQNTINRAHFSTLQNFLHISYISTWQSVTWRIFPHETCGEFLHMTKKFSTGTACGACDKYQVCPQASLTNIYLLTSPICVLHRASKKVTLHLWEGGWGWDLCDMSSNQIECHKMKYPFQYMWRVYRWRDTRWEFWNCFTHGQKAKLWYISNFGGQMTSQCQEEKHKWGCSEKPFFAPYVQAQ